MKTNAPAALYASVLLACAQITLAAYSCNLTSENDYYRNPQWKCDVCGDYLRGSSGIGCIPQNATVRPSSTLPTSMSASNVVVF